MPAVLIATLGAEPQVVSLATQLLLARGLDLQAVVVLHTAAHKPPVLTSLPTLKETFADHPGWPPLHPVALDLDDVLTPDDMETFAAALFDEIKRWLNRERQVHLLLAGGRKPMAMMGMSVAQMLLGADDRVWYLYSDARLRQSGRMTLEAGDKAELIETPLVPMTPAPPRFTRPFQASTPAEARSALAREQQRRLAHFVETELTSAEREVAALVAREVLTVNEMAARLHKAPKTVSNQLNSVYSKLESAFGLLPDKGVKREFLRRELGAYFAGFGGQHP
jgi:CRISPR-associated protein Csx14